MTTSVNLNNFNFHCYRTGAKDPPILGFVDWMTLGRNKGRLLWTEDWFQDRDAQNWSVFGSYSKGFSLPNVGIPLRNVNTPGQSVNGIVDLQAVVFDNKEGGVSWHGKQFSFSGSYYRSYSDLGSSLSVDPVTT